MKKIAVLFSLILILFTACSEKKNGNFQQKVQIPTVEQIDQTQGVISVIPTEEQLVEMAVIPTPEELNAMCEGMVKPDAIDIDMSGMNANMVYAEIFNLVIMPEEYENKNLKIKGNFAVYINKANGDRYYSIIIPDATACCQQGIEFVWAGNHEYPQDYPEIGQEITVTGVYKTTDTVEGLQYNYMQVTDLDF